MIKNLNIYKKSFDYYTELRIQENRSLRLGLLNGNLVSNDQSSESGVSSRVYKDGNWGFSSNAQINDTSITKVIKSSSENASFLNKMNKSKCGILLPEETYHYELNLSTKKNKNQNTYWIDFIKDLDNYIQKKYKQISSR